MLTSRSELGSVGTSCTDKLEVAILVGDVVLERREHCGDPVTSDYTLWLPLPSNFKKVRPFLLFQRAWKA